MPASISYQDLPFDKLPACTEFEALSFMVKIYCSHIQSFVWSAHVKNIFWNGWNLPIVVTTKRYCGEGAKKVFKVSIVLHELPYLVFFAIIRWPGFSSFLSDSSNLPSSYQRNILLNFLYQAMQTQPKVSYCLKWCFSEATQLRV